MTGLFEMHIRVGNDPRGYSEFSALLDEVSKLNHSACPDLDWGKVETLCLALFQKNGADLNTVAFFTLARSHRYGLEGMAQGIALIESLCIEESRVWPVMMSMRLDILNGLFAQLQPLLRSLEITSWSRPALSHLYGELGRLDEKLTVQGFDSLVALRALRQQISSLIQRLQWNTVTHSALHMPSHMPEPAGVMPVVILPAMPIPDVSRRTSSVKARRVALWLLAVIACLLLVSGVGWRHWLASQENERLMSKPVRLPSLSLFDAGSAELKPGSTKVLINALMDIKAQPGWLIVIAGHTDDTGNPEQNLKLSRARATAVRDWMQGMSDIADSCFAVKGYAASQPIVSNDTELGRVANRRVDIYLVPQSGACGRSEVIAETVNRG